MGEGGEGHFGAKREGGIAVASTVVAAAAPLAGIPDPDLTVELITHRFAPTSKGVLQDRYRGSDLDLDEGARSHKLTKFGSTKYVYPAETMRHLHTTLTESIRRHLPGARVLYRT